MYANVNAIAAIVFVGSMATPSLAGFDVNHTVTRIGDLDQVDVFVLNRDADGDFAWPGGQPTGTTFYGASLVASLSEGHRAYFSVVSSSQGDRVDLRNATNAAMKGWFRVGSVETTDIIGSMPDPWFLPVGTNPWASGVNRFDVSFRLAVDQPAIGIPADTFPGLHVVRLYVDPFTEVRLHGFLTEVGLGIGAEIPASNPYIIPPIPEPGLVGMVALGGLLLRRR